ncbi:MAG: SPOR domain-containing protein [Pseudomonadota bacterium]
MLINSKIKFALVVFSNLLLLSSVANAGSTYYLQLGSFYSKDDANAKWDELKSKNPNIFSNLSLNIAEVALPPDNNISYRTQAGPISSHQKADDLCNQINDISAECYVVETAIVASDKTISLIDTQATPKQKIVSKPLVDNKASAKKSIEFVRGLEPKFLDSETTIAKENAGETKSISDNKPINEAKKETTTTNNNLVVADNKKVSKSTKSKKQEKKSELIVVPGREQKFLDYNSTEQKIVSENNEKPIKLKEPKFENKEIEPKFEEVKEDEEKNVEKPGFFSRLFGTTPAKPKESVKKETVASPKNDSVANVDVAEAIRVPLSKDNNSESKSANITDSRIAPFAQQFPSQENRKYWAQINYFSDELQAQGFYEDFRNQYSEISDGLRIKITHPYGKSGKSSRISLRVGAFANSSQVKIICDTAIKKGYSCKNVKELSAFSENENFANNPSITSEQTINNEESFLSKSEQQPSYWVQLGSYSSPDEAWDKWSNVKKKFKKIIGKYEANVAEPENNSSDTTTYRLRFGAFNSSESASSICNKLSNSGENCLVVKGN